jgi:hypothetical protein
LATQNREHNREHDRVCHDSWEAGLTRTEDTTRPGGESEKETGTESQEEHSCHDEIGLGEHETHSFGDETVHEEEHERVEEHSRLSGLAVHELYVLARGGHENTGAEREKKSGRDGDFLSGDIGKHLIYVYIFFHETCKVIECGTSHHFLVKTIVIYDSPDILPYMG